MSLMGRKTLKTDKNLSYFRSLYGDYPADVLFLSFVAVSSKSSVSLLGHHRLGRRKVRGTATPISATPLS